MIRKTGYTLLITACFIWGIWVFLFSQVVPKMAYAAIPQKWKHLPVLLSRSVLHNYLGNPAEASATQQQETWLAGSAEKQYRLRVYYMNDSLVGNYAVYYQLHKKWLQKSILVDTVSVR